MRLIKRLFLCLKNLNMAFSGVLLVDESGYRVVRTSFLLLGAEHDEVVFDWIVVVRICEPCTG